MPHSPESHPVMFVMATRILLPLVLAAGIYIFLRGHNQPGGGFVAALVVAIAILLQYLASGFDWTDARRRISEHSVLYLYGTAYCRRARLLVAACKAQRYATGVHTRPNNPRRVR